MGNKGSSGNGIVRKTPADVVDVKTAELAVRQFEAGQDGQESLPVTLSDEVVEAYRKNARKTRLPNVLLNTTYAEQHEFEQAWEVYDGKMGKGAYGEVFKCIPLQPRPQGMSAGQFKKQQPDRIAQATRDDKLFVVKKVEKIPPKMELFDGVNKELAWGNIKFWHAQWLNEVHLLYLLNRTSMYTAQLTAVYEDPKRLYIVMPQMEMPLKEAWEQVRDPEKKRIGLRVVHQMLWALLELKRLRWVHGDLQLKNMCVWKPLEAGGQIGIVDFGLATYIGDQDKVNVPFLSMETIGNTQERGFRTLAYDVYCMGRCILELLGKKQDEVEKVQDPELKNMLRTMMVEDPAQRGTVEDCMTQFGLFPSIDLADVDAVGRDPLAGLMAQYQPKFEAHYQPMDDFAGGSDEFIAGTGGSPVAGTRLDEDLLLPCPDALCHPVYADHQRLVAENRRLKAQLHEVAKNVRQAASLL